jgi:hypothetical protein
MKRNLILSLLLTLAAAGVRSAELSFELAGTRAGELPKGFRSVLGGSGQPGAWQVLYVEVPSLLTPFTTLASSNSRQPVLAQTSRDKTDERFPMLVYDNEVFGDFTLTTRFKLVDGEVEQMAGIAFRWQDERNYCYVRASGLTGTIYFYEVVAGQRRPPVGNKLAIAAGVWHELTIENSGSQVRVLLNGKEAIPTLQAKALSTGKIAFWTKSDAVTYFCDTRISFTPRTILAQRLVDDTLQKYPRIVELTLFAPTNAASPPVVIASSDAGQLKTPAPAETADVLASGRVYFGKARGNVTVTMPLRDRNGEPAAAVRLVLKSFPGQTENNAVARATPIVKEMEPRVHRAADLWQ